MGSYNRESRKIKEIVMAEKLRLVAARQKKADAQDTAKYLRSLGFRAQVRKRNVTAKGAGRWGVWSDVVADTV